jgi:hypothetical protein
MAQDRTSDALAQAAATAAQAVKVAAELKARLARAPKGASPELVRAAAESLVTHRWTEHTDATKVAAALADPDTALKALAEVAQKAAEALDRLQGTANPRLESGVPVPAAKSASAAVPAGVPEAPESEADRVWTQKMASYRVSGIK